MTRVSKKICYLILAACGSGLAAKKWRQVLPAGCKFEGWVDITTTSETRDFTSKRLLDSRWSQAGCTKTWNWTITFDMLRVRSELVSRLRLAFAATLCCVLALWCCKGGTRGMGVVLTGEERMSDHFVLSTESRGVASLVAGDRPPWWVLGNNDRVYRLDPGNTKPVAVPLPLEGRVEVVNVTAATGGRLWLVWRDKGGTQHVGLLHPARAVLKRYDPITNARFVAGPDREGAVWFVGLDTGLYRVVAGRCSRVDSVGYNALALSSDGHRLLVRRIGSDDVLTKEVGTEGWRVVRRGFGGEIVGFGRGGGIVLLDMGVWQKGESRPDNRVLLVNPNGSEQELARGPFTYAAISGAHLLVVRPGPDGTSIIESLAL